MFLAACCASAAAMAAEPVTIDMPMFEGGEGLTFFTYCAREYEKLRPDVIVNLYGDPRIVDKLRVRILEGSYPEATNAFLNYPALIRSGLILPLDEFMDAPNWEHDGTWRDSFLPGSLDRYTVDAKVYGIPMFYSINTIWYNKRIFREHGWRPTRTWDEFLALCASIKAASIWPLAFQGQYSGYAQGIIDAAYYHLAGPQRFQQQHRLEPGSFDNPELEQALGLVQKMAVNYFQPGAMGMSHTGAQLEFFQGRTAMILCGSWLKSEMLGKIPDGFELGAFNLPIVDAGKADPTAVSAYSGYYFVFKDSRHPREAIDFLRFMTSREMAATFAKRQDFPVAIRGVNETALSSDLAELAEVINAAKTSYGGAASEIAPEMEQYWNDVRFALLTGKITPREGAQKLEAAAQAIREKAANPDHVTVRHVWKPVILLGLLAAAVVAWLVGTIKRMRLTRYGRRQPVQDGAPAATTVTVGTAKALRPRWKTILAFVGPAAFFYTVFVIVPCAKSFTWSTHRWDGLTGMAFVGLLNFRRLLFESDAFWIALTNNLFIMVVIPLFVLPLSLFFAACISRGIRGSRFFRIVFFFPNVLGTVTIALLWMHMYNPQGGPINAALAAAGRGLSWIGIGSAGAWLQGFAGFAWLSQDHLYWALIPMSIWGACGFNMILFLAAMESIPSSLYEAAEMDGARPWRQFWSITLPLIWDVLSIAVVFMVIGGMKTFEVIWLLTNQAPTTEVHVIGTRMVQTMFAEFKVGEAAAIAVLLFLMVFFGTVVTLRMMRRETVEF